MLKKTVLSKTKRKLSFLNFSLSVSEFLLALKLYTVSQKRIPNIIDCNLKRDYPILIILGVNISDTTCHQMTVQFLTSHNVCFCTACKNKTSKNRTSEICLEMNKKTSTDLMSPDLWPLTALTSVRSITLFQVLCSSESTGRRLGMLMNSRRVLELCRLQRLQLVLTYCYKIVLVLVKLNLAIFWVSFCYKYRKACVQVV